jgi:site-specific DNA-adenine methylase
MFSYYGAKTNLVGLYPPPKYGKIIEPFAGSARYALKFWDREVLLVDKYPVVIQIWHWLQSCSEKDILSLPRNIDNKTKFDTMKFDCDEQRLFFSFVSGCGDAKPRTQATARKTIDRPNHINYNLQRVAKNLFKIKDWKIELGSYELVKNESATWFIDPPYQVGGETYAMNNKKINFQSLAEWCRSRKGQVIVCENTKADWMDFKPMADQRGSLRTTTEAIWSNLPTAYDNTQITLFDNLNTDKQIA